MEVFLQWLDPNPPGEVVGFEAHFGPDCVNWPYTYNIGYPTPDGEGTHSSLVPHQPEDLCVALTAYNDEGLESLHSNTKDIPEASSLTMLLAGCVLLALLVRRRK